MPRKPKDKEVQPDLLPEVRAKNSKAIDKIARQYKDAQRGRMEYGREEKTLKDKLLDEVKKSGLLPNEDGVYEFETDGCMIKVKPRDELVTVRFKDEEEE